MGISLVKGQKISLEKGDGSSLTKNISWSRLGCRKERWPFWHV